MAVWNNEKSLALHQDVINTFRRKYYSGVSCSYWTQATKAQLACMAAWSCGLEFCCNDETVHRAYAPRLASI